MKSMTVQSLLLSICLFFSAVVAVLQDSISDHFEGKFLKKVYAVDSFVEGTIQEWVPMKAYESLNYFTPYEVCEGFSMAQPDFCRQKFQSDFLGCSASLFKDCPVHEGAFYRHNSTQAWPKSRNIVDLMYLMLKNGYDNLVFIGDSVTDSHRNVVLCDLERAGLQVSRKNDRDMVVRGLDLFFQKISMGFGAEIEKKPFFSTTFTIKRFYYNNYGNWKSLFAEFQKEMIAQRNGSTVVIMNKGLHYNTGVKQLLTDEYQRLFSTVIEELVQKRQFLAFFRETTAQHFDTSNGLFQGLVNFPDDKKVYSKLSFRNKTALLSQNGFNSTSQEREKLWEDLYPRHNFFSICQPAKNKSGYNQGNWRNIAAASVLQSLDPHQEFIHIVPFYRISAGRYDIHISSHDCTHFCHTPMLWHPVIAEMTRVIEHKFAASNRS
jgi:hypothetical protein